MKITLQEINDANRAICEALRVTEEQAHLIAPNARSLAQADENLRLIAMGVYADDDMVGFLLYEPRGNDVFSVHRLMIDRNHQRKGIGLRAMELVMDRIRGAGGKTIYLSFRPENVAAKQLYKKLTFQFHEEEPDGELIYRYGPVRDFPLI